jgi:hypothetical protein
MRGNAYEAHKDGREEIEVYTQPSSGWLSQPWDSGNMQQIYVAGRPRRVPNPISRDLIERPTLIRKFGTQPDFVTQLDKDILVNPQRYYKGNFRIGRGYALEPLEEGTETFYDQYDNYPNLTENRPRPQHAPDPMQDMADNIERHSTWDTRKVAYYGSNGRRSRY